MKKKILLVDDEEVSNFLTKRLIGLVDSAIEIDTTGNGREALDMIAHYQHSNSSLPAMIFLDINMPIMSGFEFMHAYNAMSLPGKESIAIYVTSSSMDPRDMTMATELGAKGFISKPVTADLMRAILKG